MRWFFILNSKKLGFSRVSVNLNKGGVRVVLYLRRQDKYTRHLGFTDVDV